MSGKFAKLSSGLEKAPDFLYHGSEFLQDSLMPGYKRTKVLTEFDQGESNRFLYATPDKDEAINQALAGLLERNFELIRFQSEGNLITATFENEVPAFEQIDRLTLYRYRIIYSDKDKWVLNDNKQNPDFIEYKTIRIIPKERITVVSKSVAEWFRDKQIILNT